MNDAASFQTFFALKLIILSSFATLKDFTICEHAAFRSYWNEENSVPVPALPVNDKKPSLLLHDLNNPDCKSSKGYKYIHDSQRVGPISLYGTSGAGKTRTIFEYLSCNYGLYLSAGADDMHNPGSMDVKYVLSEVELGIHYLSDSDLDRKRKSEENLRSVHVLLELLVCARQAVFDHVDGVLKEIRGEQNGITCYEWLLIQLFPKQFLKCDVFRDVMVELNGRRKVTYKSSIKEELSCFLDEAQVLLKKQTDCFLSSSDENGKRSAYYAFLSSLVKIHASGKLHYPCFSGTGLSIEAYKAEAKSLMNKPSFKDHSFLFFGLKNLTAAEVVEYIKKFLNLDKVGDDLVRHAGEWLKGRPRWTATFVETYIERKQTGSKREVRGNFKEEEIPLIKSLNRYIEVCTVTKQEQENKRFSWSLGDRSAGKAISNMYTKTGMQWSFAQQAFRNSTFEFALRGRVVHMKTKSAEMIEAGVASVYIDGDKKENSDSEYIKGYICEPIIIQASLNFFGLRDYTTEKLGLATSESEKGNLFEEYLLPSLQHRFKTIMNGQLGQEIEEAYSLPTCSSYGVLARRCDGASDTIKWINDTLDSRFEGIVAPFCFADTLLGPDLLSFLRTTNWEHFLFLAIQAKLRYAFTEAEALRTIVPELFYKENRSTQKNCALKNNRLQKDWKCAEERLFCMEESEEVSTSKSRAKKDKRITVRKRKRSMIRCLVQYPTKVSVEPGTVPACEYKPGPNPKDKLSDYLFTIDGENTSTFFGSAGREILELVKPSRS